MWHICIMQTVIGLVLAGHFIYLESFSFVSVAIHFGIIFSLFVIELVLLLYLLLVIDDMYSSKLVITMHSAVILYFLLNIHKIMFCV